MFNFLQCARGRALEVWIWGGGSLLMFAFCQSVCAGAEKISLTLIFLKQRGA